MIFCWLVISLFLVATIAYEEQCYREAGGTGSDTIRVCTFQAAREDSFGLEEKVGMVLQMFSSPWVKGISHVSFLSPGVSASYNETLELDD
jgi:hypothetical protein